MGRALETGDQLFADAAYYANDRARWLQRADQTKVGAFTAFTRRQCLGFARRAEARIVNLAIRAEIDAQRAMPQAGARA